MRRNILPELKRARGVGEGIRGYRIHSGTDSGAGEGGGRGAETSAASNEAQCDQQELGNNMEQSGTPCGIGGGSLKDVRILTGCSASTSGMGAGQAGYETPASPCNIPEDYVMEGTMSPVTGRLVRPVRLNYSMGEVLQEGQRSGGGYRSKVRSGSEGETVGGGVSSMSAGGSQQDAGASTSAVGVPKSAKDQARHELWGSACKHHAFAGSALQYLAFWGSGSWEDSFRDVVARAGCDQAALKLVPIKLRKECKDLVRWSFVTDGGCSIGRSASVDDILWAILSDDFESAMQGGRKRGDSDVFPIARCIDNSGASVVFLAPFGGRGRHGSNNQASGFVRGVPPRPIPSEYLMEYSVVIYVCNTTAGFCCHKPLSDTEQVRGVCDACADGEPDVGYIW